MHNVVDLPGQNAGFLDGRFDPFQITQVPNVEQFHVPNLRPGLGVERTVDRLGLLQQLDQATWSSDNSWSSYHDRAIELIQNRQVKQAFRVDHEPAAVRDRYGRTTLGQSLLLARKLVEANVRFINVHDKVYNGRDANWDRHANVFPRHRDYSRRSIKAFRRSSKI